VQRQRSGFTLLELLFVMSVMLIAFLSLAQSIVASMALTRVNRESALAGDGIRQAIEVLQGRAVFDEVFEDFRPGSPSGPGSGFTVAGLEPTEGDPDGLVGQIVFPTLDTAGGFELREDLDLPELGMPRDLDGDGAIDSANHSGDYRLLPVLVRVSWRGVSGERTTETCTLLSDR